ncbi:Uncharacterised protein [Mycobacteroides abscessus]|nr:Uncharacterised protein [Mycobacteroides abscessus]
MCCIWLIILVVSSACFNMSSTRSFPNGRICNMPALCRLIWNGIDVRSIGLPSGRVMLCTMEIPCTAKRPLASLCRTTKSAGLRISWSASRSMTSGVMRDSGKCRCAAA